MSIEAMKRIKSLLQDGDKIDSHTISAVVAECDAVILAQQPVTGEPVAWIRRHPNGALSNELLIHVQVEQVRRDSGAWVPLYTHPAPSVLEFSRIAKRKLDELQKQGFGITGYAIQRGTQRGFITNGGFVGWWRSDEAPSVPEGYVPVPLQVLRDASEALGNFVSDHGWGDDDMQAMDNLDAYIARHDAKAQKGQP